ncbi:MAG: DUF308 domain-containing protein [Oscillospiraceae bacterium]|nr:DUF308 domain-containing protein [Oscillospiraceae bacterium]
MREKNTANQSRHPDALPLQILLALISILLGILLLFVPQISISVLCYFFCGGMIAIGIGMIVAFFVSDAYKLLHNYFFSIGVLIIILGCCGLIRNSELCERFTFFLGVTALVLSVFILQNTIQMRVLNNPLWIADLILAVPSIIAAILVLVDLKPLLKWIPTFPYWALLISSILSLVSLLLTTIGLFVSNRKAARPPEEDPAASPVPAGPVPSTAIPPQDGFTSPAFTPYAAPSAPFDAPQEAPFPSGVPAQEDPPVPADSSAADASSDSVTSESE